jgi:polysaccharide biosynthesis protein PslH
VSVGSRDAKLKVLWVKSGGLLPLNTGGMIRSFNLLKELARNHEVTLFTFYGRQTDDKHLELERYFSHVVCLPMDLPAARGVGEAIDYARNMFSTTPYTMAKYCRPQVADTLLKLLRRESFDVIVCDFLFSADVIPWDWPVPKVLFTHNVEEQIWRRHFEVSRNPVWKAVSWREYRTMRAAERHYIRLADHVLAVSENDRSYFARYSDPDKISVVPTGVDIEYFHVENTTEKPGSLVFTGSLDWLPNEDAILFFAESILPRLVQELSDVEMRIVGRKPSPSLRALAEGNRNIKLIGEVPDIRPHVHESSVYVVPLRIGGGTRIKIFEAMAMGKAVISTPVGAEGLPVCHGENILLAEQPAEFARETARLLRDRGERERIGRAARLLVEQNYSWRSVAGVFDRVFREVTDKAEEPLKEVVHS